MKIGLEVLFDSHLTTLKANVSVLVVNPTSTDQSFEHAADLFAACKDFQLTALFGPSTRNSRRDQDNMIEWEGYRDPRTGHTCLLVSTGDQSTDY